MDFKKKQKFSIRKLTLGTVSVFLGATLVLGNNVVEANELEKTEQKSEEKVKIGYLGVDEKDLNDIEKKLIEKKDITEEVAKENDTYVVVYKGKEAVKNVLPKTGLSGNILNLLIAGGLILCIYRLGNKKSTLIGIVIVTTISGVTSLKTIKAEEVLKEIFRNTIVYKENSNLEKLDLDNFEYLGYIKDENIPTNTRLYKLVEDYKKSILDGNKHLELKNTVINSEDNKNNISEEKSVENPIDSKVMEEKADSKDSVSTEEKIEPKEEVSVEKETSDKKEPKEIEKAEKPKDNVITEEKAEPKEEASIEKETSEKEEPKEIEKAEKPKNNVITEEKVDQPKEKESVEEGKSDSTVSEKPKEETKPTEEAEQPKETESVEEEKPDSTEGESKEETKSAEEAEKPREPESVEEGKSEETVEESKEETKPTEEVEKPKETESVEEEKPDSTEGESKEETIPAEEAEKPREPESVEEGKSEETVEESKEETEPTEEVEKLKETPSVEAGESESTVEEKPTEEAEQPKEETKPAEEVEQPKETENEEEGNSNSTVEEIPKEEANPTEEVEKPKETEAVEEKPSEETKPTEKVEEPKEETKPTEEAEKPKETEAVEEGKSDSTVEEKPKEEEKPGKGTNPAEEVEQPKETPSVEEGKSDSTAEESKEETNPAEKVEKPKEKEAVEEVKPDSTVSEKPKEETKPTEEAEKPKEEKELLEAHLSLENLKAKVQEVESKKIEISNDKLINPIEKTELDKLIKEATTLKSEATTLVNNLADSDKKVELSNELSSIKIPSTVEINDSNSNGKIDTTREAETAEVKVQEAIEAANTAATKKQALEKDGAISEAETAELDRLISEAESKKESAKLLVNTLPDSDKKDELSKELSSLAIPSTVEINDSNSNGKIDTTREADSAEAKVQAAIEAANRAATKKQELERDGATSEAEKSELDRLISEANTKKSEAERLVNNLPLSDKKETLKTSVSSINNIPTTVIVNDKNANGKIDTTSEAEAAEAKVQEAIEAANTAATKKQELERDVAISEAEKLELDRLIIEAESKKAEAKSLVNTLPDSDKKDSLTEELYRVSIPESLEVTPKEETKEELKETKIEFKNVEHAYLYKLNNNNEFEKVLSIDTVDKDLSKYKVKAFLKDANKNIWLDVKSINLLDNKYKVDTSFDNLVSIDNNLKLTDTYSIEVAKRNEKSKDNEYNSFSDMIEAMKLNAENNNITGEYILVDNISASEISVDNNSGSYLDNYIFKGTLKSKTGKVFSITDLKKPLFNNIIDANISNINLKDVDVSNLKDSSVGSLANESYNSNISNINVNGNVRGKDGVGGLIGVLRNNSRISNSSYTGIVSSLKSVGGLTSNITENSIIENSYADINISTTAADSYSVGGLTAQVNGNSSITNSYVKGTIENNGNKNLKVGGVVGGVYYSDKYTGTIDNVISFVKVKNGRDFIGNLNELKASGVTTIANNYVVNKLVDNEYTNFVNSIDNDSAKSKIKPMYTNNTLETINTNTSNIDYSNLENYKNKYNKAYENMAKLLPFYDRYTIVREANKLLENDNLNTKTIKYIKTFVGENLVKDIYNEKNNINNIVIHYTDGTKDTISVQIKGEFNNSGILEYYVSGKNIIYTPNILSKDRNLVIDNLVSEINKLEFNKDLFNWTNVANPHNDSYDKIIEKLYIKDNFSKVKNNLKSYLISLINNYDILYGTNKNFENLIISKINNNKKSILAGLTYIDRWYDFSEAKNNLLYSLDMYATKDNSLDLVIDIGSQTIDVLASNITDTAYENVISRYTGKRTVTDFIKDLYEEERNSDETIESWFKKMTKAYLIRTDSSYNKAPRETIFERLSSLGHRYWLLPLLTVKDENVYGFFTTNSSNMGIFDSYITVNKNDSSYKDELSKVKKKVDDAAHAMQRYFDVWYRILNESSSSKLAETKIQVFDGYKNKTTGIWSSEFGSGALDSVKAFAGPIRGWDAKAKRAIAHAVNIRGINRVHFTGYEGLLEEGGLSTLTHEHTHNLDADVLFGGYGRRLGHGPESYARGLLQTPDIISDTLGINLIYNVPDNEKNLLKYNSSPTRFQNADDLQQYMKGVFDVLYTLDLAEAEVILEKGKSFIENRYKKLDLLDSNGAVSKDRVSGLWGISNVNTIYDLVDANVIGGNIISTYYGNNDYIEIDMFNAHYGINENTRGASGGLTLRRVGFELLAEKGYYGGMLPYISGKYYYEKGSDINIANTDSYILQKIFGEKYNSYKDFRKDMFRQRDKNKEYLKSIDVWYSNKNEHINSYEDIKKLIRKAIDSNNTYELSNIKRNIYQAYLKSTNEFRTSIYKSEPEVSEDETPIRNNTDNITENNVVTSNSTTLGDEANNASSSKDSIEENNNQSEEQLKIAEEIARELTEVYKNINYKSKEVYEAAGYKANRNIDYSHLDTLLLENSFGETKSNIQEQLQKLALQILKRNNNNNKENAKKYLEDNKAKISLGLAYFSRWYNINFNENNNFKDKLLFEYENYGTDNTLAEFLVNIRENISSDLKEDAYLPENNDKLYKEKVSKITKANTIYEFLKQNVQKYNRDKDFNTWFKEHSKAYIVEEKPKNIPLEVKISERLNKEDFQRIYLPLLTMSGSGLYVIPTATSITFGDMETYINKNIDKNSEEYKKELEKVKELVRIAAKNQTMHFDFWYRVALDNVKKVLVDNKVIILDSFLNKSDKKWTAKYGNNSTLATREFFAPSGRYHNRTTSADAFSNGDIITFSETLLLSLQGGSIWTHEVTHALEDKVHLGGNGLRPGIGQESYAEGLFQSVRDRNRNSIGLNVYSELTDKDKEVLKNINTTPERFQNAEDLKTYMHNLLDVIYVLDIAEANSFLKKNTTSRRHMIASMTGIKDNDSNNNRDSVASPTNNNSLKSINDLVDNNIVITRTDFKGAVTITNGPEAGRNTYVSAPLFSPMYGLLENDKGSSGGYTFRRTAWELLAHKGYENGMIPYISDKYAAKAKSEGQELSDSYIVKEIFKDDNSISSLKDFKKAMFKERQDKLNKLKPITIIYEGKKEVISDFRKLQSLMNSAFNKDLISSWNNREARKVFDLKQAIFVAYLKQTNDFNVSIFNENR